MADAISSKSTAVEIITLGIQACEGLVAYYNSEKSSSQEQVTRTTAAIDALLAVLRQLKSVVGDQDFPVEQATLVFGSLQDCRIGICGLQDELERVRREAPHGDWTRTITTASHADDTTTDILYPFRESTLHALRRSTGDVRTNLVVVTEKLRSTTTARYSGQLDGIAQQLVILDQKMGEVVARRDESLDQALAWLSQIRPAQKQQRLLERYVPGTGDRLLKSKEFGDWISGKTKLLWCHGSPGSGKSVLSSAVVQHLQTTITSPAVGVAFIFCDYAKRQTHTVEELLGSLIQQLVMQNPTCQRDVTKLHEVHAQAETRPTRDELATLLQTVLSSFQTAFVVVDGWNECEEDIAMGLLDEITSLQYRARILWTSRSLPHDLGSRSAEATTFHIQAQKDEIRVFLEALITRDNSLRQLCQEHAGLREKIIDVLVRKTNNLSFPLAHIYIRSISAQTQCDDVEEALKRLIPATGPALANGTNGKLMRIPGLMASPLHLASLYGLDDAIISLAKDGYAPDITIADEWTPLHLAVLAGHVTTADCLLRHKAKTEARCKWTSHLQSHAGVDLYGCTPLHIAAITGNQDMMQVLIDGGAHVDALDDRRYSPLMAALAAEKIYDLDAVIKILLDEEADVNCVGEHGTTPLLLAVRRSSLSLIRLLQQAGADPEVGCGLEDGLGPANSRIVVETLLRGRRGPMPEVLPAMSRFQATPARRNRAPKSTSRSGRDTPHSDLEDDTDG